MVVNNEIWVYTYVKNHKLILTYLNDPNKLTSKSRIDQKLRNDICT